MTERASKRRRASTLLTNGKPEAKQHCAGPGDGDEDEETLRLKIELLQAKLKLKALQKKRLDVARGGKDANVFDSSQAESTAISQADLPKAGAPLQSSQQGTFSSASFLGLPLELRERIYAHAVPLGTSMHISYQGDSYTTSSCFVGRQFNKGKGLTRKVCVSHKEDDHTKAKRWIETGRPIYVSPYETRHTDCLYSMASFSNEIAQPVWPFALLFVCRQSYQELRSALYKQCSFAFRSGEDLKVFSTKVPAECVAQITDLRFWLRMGSGGRRFEPHCRKYCPSVQRSAQASHPSGVPLLRRLSLAG